MFLSRYKKFRARLLENVNILGMAHLGAHAFDSIGGEVVSTTCFVLCHGVTKKAKGQFVRLVDGMNESEKQQSLLAATKNRDLVHMAGLEDFVAIEDSPIAYWISDELRSCFTRFSAIKEVFTPAVGLNTGDNNRFLRQWFEVSFNSVNFRTASVENAISKEEKWFPYNKGGSYRKWYGNQEFVVNWENNGSELKEFATYRNKGKHWSRYIQNLDCMFRECITWSDITTSNFAARYSSEGFLFDVKGSSGTPKVGYDWRTILAVLCSKLMPAFMKAVNPTTTFQVGDLARVPIPNLPEVDHATIASLCNTLIEIVKADWDAFETSWNFSGFALFNSEMRLLEDFYSATRSAWTNQTNRVLEMETKTNRLLLEAYGLANEISPNAELEDITINCNPIFRYDGNLSDSVLESLLLADTMREFISYAVGCILGRYSLDKPGLILANQGDSLREYFRLAILDFGLTGEYDDSRFEECMEACTFAPDEDNVLPILEGDWFSDDISQRFKEFLKVTFGTEHHDENLTFLENALYSDNITAKKRKTIRDYFLKEFYDHHLKMYKKRPIYWLFSSPKGTFNALIYMHRYRPETVGTVLQYLRDFRDKLAHHAEHRQMIADSSNESKTVKTQAIKEVATIKKQLKELEDYEKTLFEVAARKIEIDLDNGVKHNYPLFGPVLRKIPGLEAKDD